MRPTKDCGRCARQIGPNHSGDCQTDRGRLLARPCRTCGTRFALYSSRDRRVNCIRCRKTKAAAAPSKPVKVKPLSLAERRAALELEAFPATGAMHRLAAYQILRYAVSKRHGLCDRCGKSCDVTNATLVMIGTEKSNAEPLLCAVCGPEARSPNAPAHVASWLWGAELGDSHTRMLSATLAR